MIHKQKVRLARHMRSRADIQKHVPIIPTDAWIDCSYLISEQVRKIEKKNIMTKADIEQP